ncbi:DgyrCDS5234 [Dimorphilus gyrociliatus]|uniref:DgyrCDS5234 n=1 Tax=Dimorphilus gyrociliatus TaxID=2664684 RepID=A0A7I8VJ77_9ANNE|nr:DgyrCDS5234 [Dimorphilus gyrociliatus]
MELFVNNSLIQDISGDSGKITYKFSLQNYQVRSYVCKATNRLGSLLSPPATIRIAPLIFMSNDRRQVRTKEGEYRIIKRPMKDHEFLKHWEFSWYRIPSGIYKSTRQTLVFERPDTYVTLHGDLILLNIPLNHTGVEYMASAVNEYKNEKTTTRSNTFTLIVEDNENLSPTLKPEMLVKPKNVSAKVLETVFFECVGSARPLNRLKYRWFRVVNGRERDIHSGFNNFKRLLQVTKVDSSKAGEYGCEISYEGGGIDYPSVRHTAWLTILNEVSEIFHPWRDEAYDGGDKQITCHLERNANPKPVINWYKDAVIIPKTNQRYQIIEEGFFLKISTVSPQDKGVYQCVGHNVLGYAYSAVYLDVKSEPARIVTPPTNKTVTEKESISFYCEAYGAPIPKIRWFRKRKTAPATEELTSTSERIEVLGNTIKLRDTALDDMGTYICNASNSKGWDTKSTYLIVFKRTIIIKPPTTNRVIKGNEANFQCGASYDDNIPKPRWTWYFRTLSTDPFERVDIKGVFTISTEGSLIIKHVDTKHVGSYKCEVTSISGNESRMAELIVIETPTLSIEKIELLQEKFVNISWKIIFDGNSQVQTVSIQAQRVSDRGENYPWEHLVRDVPPSPSWYQIRNLKPATTYKFQVRGVNGAGEGEGSRESKTITLPQQPPSEPPQAVSVEPRTSTELIVGWEAPNKEGLNGKLKGYIIKYQLKGYQDWNLENITKVSEQRNLYSLDGLTVFSTYNIQIAAYNERGVGVYSKSVSAKTKEGTPSRPPTILESSKAISSTAIRLEWNPPPVPNHHGVILGYYIALYPKPASDYARFLNKTYMIPLESRYRNQSYTVANLAKFTSYDISIAAFTSGGIGMASANKTIGTKEDIPDAVENLSFNSLLDTSVNITWSPPKRINGILIGYFITYQRKDYNLSQESKRLPPSTRSYEISKLQSLTSYVISIQAQSRKGLGIKRIIEAKTGEPPELPKPPTILGISDLQDRSVQIKFTPGFDGYTSINFWIVEGQIDGREDMDFFVIEKISSPNSQAITVFNLLPFTKYRLRLLAENIKGSSSPSLPTRWFTTDQSIPSSFPTEVTVRAFNETSLTIRWTPLDEKQWNGDERGYKIQYGINRTFNEKIEVKNDNASLYTIHNLKPWTEYDVRIAAFNAKGDGKYSPQASERTFESVPGRGPSNVKVVVLNSTTIIVSWGDIPKGEENGLILGFKIKYTKERERRKRSVNKGTDLDILKVNNPNARSAYIYNLHPFVSYEVAVAAFTRLGDGVYMKSNSPVETFSDVPSIPKCLYFPTVDIGGITAQWCPPEFKNGKDISYSLKYRKLHSGNSVEFSEDEIRGTSYVARKEIDSWNVIYEFRLSAKNENGTGKEISAKVTVRENRLKPVAPQNLRIEDSQIRAYSLSLFWSFKMVDYYELRNYTVQSCLVDNFNECVWKEENIDINPSDTRAVINGLKPVTKYKFRIAANNDVGRSVFSKSTEAKTTSPAPPTAPPSNIIAQPFTESSVRVSWLDPPKTEWNSNRISSYVVKYGPLQWPTSEAGYNQPVVDNAKTIELQNLRKHTLYEIRVRARNSMGDGPWSQPIDIYVGEAIPSESPLDLTAEPISSTEIQLAWKAPPKRGQHGNILGYKVLYWIAAQKDRTVLAINVPSATLRASLKNLEMYTLYDIAVLAFNAAGEGPQTPPVTQRTKQGLPGKPGELSFIVTSLSSLNLSWTPPEKPNGVIELYKIQYSQTGLFAYGKEVINHVDYKKTSHEAKDLEENINYIFSVQAKTKVGWGEKRSKNFTIGPVPGSPKPPFQLKLDTFDTYANLRWFNVPLSSERTLSGYIIQKQEYGNKKWEQFERLTITNSDMIAKPIVKIPFYSLNPKTDYVFRVFALNKIGISSASEASPILQTPDFKTEEFYKQWWFAAIISLVALILIILIVTILCFTGRRSRRLKKKHADMMPTAVISPTSMTSMATVMTNCDREDEDGFGTINSRRSIRSRHSERSRKGARNGHPGYIRSPPRPSPAAVNYDDDDDSCRKSQIEDDRSSLAKRSISSDENSCGKASTLSDFSEKNVDDEFPPPFTSAVNMNRKSWNGSAQKYKSPPNIPPPLPPNHPRNNLNQNNINQAASSSSIYNYTDSEPSESPYAISLNAGHVVMSNKAGSRAPLPGFSSFV